MAYQFPKALINKAKLSSASIYFRGTNLLTWTRDKDLFLEPETNGNGNLEGRAPIQEIFANPNMVQNPGFTS